MSSYDLPIILVSATDNTTATKIISELIDNDVEDNKYKEAGWHVWRLENKYYEVCVRLQALPDAEALTSTLPRADAHLIYLTETEGAGEAEERRARAAPLLRRGAVRLVLLDALAPTGALTSWATSVRYEPVALREDGGEGECEGEGEVGVARARGALHAHVWPGLRRRGAAPAPLFYSDDEESSDGGSCDEEDEESAVERAEAFAEALGVLGAVGAAGGVGAGGGVGAEGGVGAAEEEEEEEEHGLRRERAEQLVAAFCRALGHDLRLC